VFDISDLPVINNNHFFAGYCASNPARRNEEYFAGFIVSPIISRILFSNLLPDIMENTRLDELLDNNKEDYIQYLLDKKETYYLVMDDSDMVECISYIKNDSQAAIMCRTFIYIQSGYCDLHGSLENPILRDRYDRIKYDVYCEDSNLYSKAVIISHIYFAGMANVTYIYNMLLGNSHLYKAYPKIYIAELVKFIRLISTK
jgi:hypothetical protein